MALVSHLSLSVSPCSSIWHKPRRSIGRRWKRAAKSAAPPAANGLDRARLADELAALLHGHGGSATRLSDAALVKLFRLLRLARRLLDLEAGVASQDS